MNPKKKICPTCGEEKYLWNKKVGCKECAVKAKTEKPRTVLKKVSSKRKEQEKEYSKLRKKHLEDNPKCVCCGGEADQIHHRLQIRYGKFLNDTSQFLSVCGSCHQEIHANVSYSVERGYLASKEEKAKYLRENL